MKPKCFGIRLSWNFGKLKASVKKAERAFRWWLSGWGKEVETGRQDCIHGNLTHLFLGSSVKYVDTFRIALTEESKLLIKQKPWLRQSTFCPLIILWHWKSCLFRLQKYADRSLKNHYIISKKTYITNGKNTYKKQVCNQQRIN